MHELLHVAVLPLKYVVKLALRKVVVLAQDLKKRAELLLLDLLSQGLSLLGLNLVEVLFLDSALLLCPGFAY